MGNPKKGNSLMVIAEANKLPGALQGASSTDEVYFLNSAGVDSVLTIPVKLIRNRPFRIRLGGRVQGAAGTTPDIEIQLDAGRDIIANNTTIATTGSIALDNDTSVMTFFLEADLLLGEVDSKLQGRFKGWVNNTVVAAAISVESVENLIADGALHFKASLDMSESIALHGARLEFFECIADGRPV